MKSVRDCESRCVMVYYPQLALIHIDVRQSNLRRMLSRCIQVMNAASNRVDSFTQVNLPKRRRRTCKLIPWVERDRERERVDRWVSDEFIPVQSIEVWQAGRQFVGEAAFGRSHTKGKTNQYKPQTCSQTCCPITFNFFKTTLPISVHKSLRASW